MKTQIKFNSREDQTSLLYYMISYNYWFNANVFSFSLYCFLVIVVGQPGSSWGDENRSRFRLPQIEYNGGNFKPRPEAVKSLLAQVAKRTSVEVQRDFLKIKLTDPVLFRHPMIYLVGNASFDPFDDEKLRLLRNYLNLGGFLLIDDATGEPSSSFDSSIRKMISSLFPNTPLKKIPRDHSIFRSFYLINRVTGRIMVKPYLEGIDIKGRTALVYSANDLGGAWSTNKLGHWKYDMIGGGALQRKISSRLGINIVLYALTLDYKKDMVHLPIILERLRRYNGR
tara:strand:- start:156 stop:1004 length:849 start_codon:yes stop_codon:yes gene_type:complete